MIYMVSPFNLIFACFIPPIYFDRVPQARLGYNESQYKNTDGGAAFDTITGDAAALNWCPTKWMEWLLKICLRVFIDNLFGVSW